jgi:hypothetical protein
MIPQNILAELWPTVKPDVSKDDHNWFSETNKIMLRRLVDESTRYIIELGSWLGTSTRFLLNHAPLAQVFAVDIWERIESPGCDYTGVEDKVPHLFDTFLVNCWDWKSRLYPLKMKSQDGLRLISSWGVKPDLIYVDADHSYPAVYADIETSLLLFPEATICGDDWNWRPDLNLPVQSAVKDVASKYNMTIHAELGWPWHLERK